nr:HutD family protein [Eubacteriales bacterium]
MRNIISKGSMPVSSWSGGRTTEIFIFPVGERYSDRNFLFRISTAEVELDSSDFTSLPDYERLIACLSGEMHLTHNGSDSIRVEPMSSVHRFDGGADTHCEGRASDLNLMLRKGRAKGSLRFVSAGEKLSFCLSDKQFAVIYSPSEGRAAVMTDGKFTEETASLSAVFYVELI